MGTPTRAAAATIAEYLESQAFWRDQVAGARPQAARAARGAAALRALAAHVRRLPPHDERLQVLAAHGCRELGGGPLDVFLPGSAVEAAIARFRGRAGGADCDRFLDRLAKLALADAVESMHSTGGQPRWMEDR